ncbi:MAG TPA: hypothetical protein GX512_06335 [Firmicutes bacterium]|nr:hypothetical protein [Candidatus Fermentithermobacillaceae bacterium]
MVELAVGPEGSESVVIEMDDETDRSGKPQGGKSAGGKTGGMTGGKAPEAKAEQAQGDPAGGRRLVSFDRKNVSKVKLLYREEDYRKGLN